MPETVTRRYIREMSDSERICGAFSIINTQLGRTRSDKPYLRCLLGDRTGEVAGRMWSIDEVTFRRLPPDGFVFIEGETQAYQGDIQIIIHTIDVIEPTDAQIQELLPCAERPIEEMFAELVGLLDTLEHPSMKALAASFLGDEFFIEAFKKAPAAKSLHHAYIGGLLEHTLQLLKLADAICPLYPKISRDIVMMGLFLHDIGKTRELVYDRTFAYSPRGMLVGHIVEGAVMLRAKAQQVMRETGQRLPPHAALVLEHIILSHHGEAAFGAVKTPSTPEAILVSLLDNVDAKTAMALAATRQERNPEVDLRGDFTEKHWALGARLFRPDPLGE